MEGRYHNPRAASPEFPSDWRSGIDRVMTVLFADARYQIGKVDCLSIDRFDHDPSGGGRH
jgi:hypothetical protein